MVSLGSAGRFNSSRRGICLSHSYSFFIPPSLIQRPDPQVPASTSARRHLFLLKQTLHPSSPCLGAKSLLFVLHHPLSDESWQKTKNRMKMMRLHVRENEGPKRKPWKQAETRVFWLWINPIDYTAKIWVVTQLLLLYDINKRVICRKEMEGRGQQERWRKRINAEAHKVIKSSYGQALKAIISSSQ